MDQATFWPGSGGSQFSSISRRTWAAQCHDNTTGLYLGLDGFSPSILTEIVNTGSDHHDRGCWTNKGFTFVVYIIHTYIHTYICIYVYADTHADIYCKHLGFVKYEDKASLERNTWDVRAFLSKTANVWSRKRGALCCSFLFVMPVANCKRKRTLSYALT